MNTLILRGLISTAAVIAAALSLSALAGDDTVGSGGHRGLQMMDTDHDGHVSADEHAAGAKRMFAKLDADHDGNLTAAELDAAHMAKKHGDHEPKGRMSSAERIQVIDTNGDGVLSAKEHEAGSHSMFEKMDTDHDGRLTAEEIDAGHAKMMKKPE